MSSNRFSSLILSIHFTFLKYDSSVRERYKFLLFPKYKYNFLNIHTPTVTSPDMTSSTRRSHDIDKEVAGVSHGQAEGLSGGGDFRRDRRKVATLTRRRRWGVFVTMETRGGGRRSSGGVVAGRSIYFQFGWLWLAAFSSSLLLIITTVWSTAATSCSIKTRSDRPNTTSVTVL